MAQQQRRSYADDGGAAIDMYRLRSNTARELELPVELPLDRPAQRKAVRARLELRPLALVGMLVAALLLAMVVFAYVRLYEQTSRAGELNSQIAALEEQNAKLRSSYENSIDLPTVEEQARALGMRQPASNQTIYVSIPGTDKAEVLGSTDTNIFSQTWSALVDGVAGIVEYFS